MEDASTADAGDDGHHNGDDQRQPQRIAHIGTHQPIVLGSERLGHGNGEPRTGSIAEAHDEEHDARRSSHGSQGFHTDEATHNGGVDDEIELLENITQDEGKCET